ncbi:putative PhiRv2 prophage protein [Mycobacterium tuberculosis H37Rv] [Mycobacterium shimoidei]|uniref:Putative PhiRv2 prophage protein [Mycobacterium tuberculosis H37Rv] n=1 Tax=Mycobacterium shimoidei TaxID=29313 RepID=A0A375YXI7_MYCSH|nr:phage major capsid protein [Mycobacterium shimoidei]SRX93567.1 putative PhiRv2 prophage protein [Mycobacterium tuberculosis H37Rv] [Mycobacterium shimoidei]
MSEDTTTQEERKAPTLTHSQSVKRMDEIHARMEEIGEQETITPEDRAEFDELRSEFEQLREHAERLEVAAELAAVRSAAPNGKRKLRVDAGSSQGSRADYDRDAILEPDSIEDCRFRNPWDLSEVRTYGREPEDVATELRARALAAIEKMPGANDNIRQAATEIIERFDDKESRLAKHALLTSNPVYLRAWSKMARNPQNAMLTPEEARALNEVRAMSLTDAAGGYLVPFQLDPTVIITSDGSQNDIRLFARQVVATGDVWHGVSAGAVEWSWDGEATEVSDDAPTFAQPTIPNHKAQGFVPISIEALQDEANVTQEIGRLLAFGREELEAEALITGTGSGEPKGLITALDGTAAEVAPTSPETFALADVYNVYGKLPSRFRRRASWLANNLIYNQIRQFDQYGGGGLWTTLGNDRPQQLIGRNIGEAEAMDGVINPDATEDNFVLVFGDFMHYVITDRVGMSVEFIPHLFGSNRRPTGQRGWYAYYRVGADVTYAGAFRVLNIATTGA